MFFLSSMSLARYAPRKPVAPVRKNVVLLEGLRASGSALWYFASRVLVSSSRELE